MFNKFKNLSYSSLIYGFGTMLSKALAFFLVPVYTRYLLPSDYGIVATFTVVVSFLLTLLTLGLNGSVGRLYFDYRDNQNDLKVFIGTIIIFLLVTGLVVSVVLTYFGQSLFSLFISEKELPFNPYIRIAVWTSFFSLVGQILLIIYRVRKMPFQFIGFQTISFILNIGLTIFFVVALRQGALGSVKGTYYSAIVMTIVALIFLIPQTLPKIDFQKLIASLKFGMPLIPHALAGVALVLFDRILLARYRSILLSLPINLDPLIF